MSSSRVSTNPDRTRPFVDSGTENPIVGETQREASALAGRLGTPWVTTDILFAAYLVRMSRFGFFTFGPITIDVHLIEDILARTVHNEGYEGVVRYSDDFVEFSRSLSEEVRGSGRRRLDELHILLAFMRWQEGLPGRVFSELGVTVEQVEQYVRSMQESPQIPGDEPLYSPEEAAEYLGVHVKTVRSWIRSGRLAASRLAGQRALRIRASDLQGLLEPVAPDEEI